MLTLTYTVHALKMSAILLAVAKMEVCGFRGQTISLAAERLQNNLFAAQQALHCHWVPRLNWMVHRLLNYFYIPAFHGRLKAYYWRDWDHRNLLHVWPFKAFHHDGSQVRIYWNQFLSESSLLAHQSSPVWNIHFIKYTKREKEKRQPLDYWKWATF